MSTDVVTATDEFGNVAQTTITVSAPQATIWKPRNWRAQRDPWKTQEVQMGLVPWSEDQDGAFTSYDALNNGHSLQPQADGSIIYEVHSGGIDHPGTSPTSGGDRAGLGVNSAGLATTSGPAGTQLVGVNGRELWYRIELSFPSGMNVFPLTHHLNAGEWHGKASGASVLKLGINGAGDHYGITFAPLVLGVWGSQQWVKLIPIVPDERHVWDVGALWTTDATGWLRVYLDGSLAASLDQVQTMKTFANGSTEPTTFGSQLYREKTDAAGNPLPPSQLRIWRLGIADSLANLG